jgi:DNA-binding response OmpR family regulator
MDANAAVRAAVAQRFGELGWHVESLSAAVPHSALLPLRLHVLVLDIELLGQQASSYLERLVGELPDLGVIVCTGRSTVAQRVRALGMGVDDWLTKPFDVEELAARVEAVVRRRRRMELPAEKELLAGELVLRVDDWQAFVGATSVQLTSREFELLLLLARSEGQVLPREEIYQRIWGYAMVAGDRSVDVFVRKLRQKLEKASPEWRYLHTTFGVGYRFAPERAS